MAGNTVVLTRKGLPVACILPMEGSAKREFDAPLPADMLLQLDAE